MSDIGEDDSDGEEEEPYRPLAEYRRLKPINYGKEIMRLSKENKVFGHI